NIEKKYWTAVSLQEKQLTLSQAQSLLDSLYKDASNAFEAGLIVENDLRQVEEKMDELKSAGIKLRGGLRLAKMDLFNAIGYEYSILGLDSLHFSDSIDSLQSPSYYIVEDSELPVCDESRLLALKVQAEQLEKKMAVGENLPQVMVGASYGYNNIQGKPLPTTNGVGFVSVQIPITDIGKAAHKAKRYNYQIEKAQNEKEYLDAQLVLRRQMYMLSMQTAWEELQLSEAKAANAVSRAIRAESEYKAGRSTVSEWLKAELDSRTASEDYINRCIDYRNTVREYLDCL
ncbi:MAG: TolC family protein, partial [Bacteroidales bacterium]|nr:TolC family protein [Candidatus Cryptobacteroides equifaecalis]